jgi:hypothetical protein
MCKIIAIYNQTFIKSNGTTNEMRCQFQRIYKHNPNQFFIIKATVAKIDTVQYNGQIFLKEMPTITMKSNNTNDNNTENNHWYIGSLADSAICYEMRIDDIPLDAFVVYNNHASNHGFVVNFQIELREN